MGVLGQAWRRFFKIPLLFLPHEEAEVLEY